MLRQAKIASAIVFFSLVLAFGLVFYSTRKQAGTDERLDSSNSAGDIKVSEEVILSGAKIDFPEISSGVPMEKSQFPESLFFLLADSVSGTQFKNVTYEGGQSGFEAEYELTAELIPRYLSLRKQILASSGWKIKFGARDERVAVIEAESAAYQLRVVLERVSDSAVNHKARILIR